MTRIMQSVQLRPGVGSSFYCRNEKYHNDHHHRHTVTVTVVTVVTVDGVGELSYVPQLSNDRDGT
jgi:hypothetical protein